MDAFPTEKSYRGPQGCEAASCCGSGSVSLMTNDVKFLMRSLAFVYLLWRKVCSRFLPVIKIKLFADESSELFILWTRNCDQIHDLQIFSTLL